MVEDLEVRKSEYAHYCTKLQGLREKAKKAERKGHDGKSS